MNIKKIFLISVIFVSIVYSNFSFENEITQKARSFFKKGEFHKGIEILKFGLENSKDKANLYEEIGKSYFYEVTKTASVSNPDIKGDIFGETAELCIQYLEKAIEHDKKTITDSYKILSTLYYDRLEFDKAGNVISAGFSKYPDDQEMKMYYSNTMKKVSEKAFTPVIIIICGIVTFILLVRALMVFHPGSYFSPEEFIKIEEDKEIVLESVLTEVKWGSLMLVCGWTIALLIAPASISSIIYSFEIMTIIVESVVLFSMILFFGSAFLFFGKKVLKVTKNGELFLLEINPLQKKIDWKVNKSDLKEILLIKSYHVVTVNFIPRTIPCSEIVLKDSKGNKYPVLYTPNLNEAGKLIELLEAELSLK